MSRNLFLEKEALNQALKYYELKKEVLFDEDIVEIAHRFLNFLMRDEGKIYMPAIPALKNAIEFEKERLNKINSLEKDEEEREVIGCSKIIAIACTFYEFLSLRNDK